MKLREVILVLMILLMAACGNDDVEPTAIPAEPVAAAQVQPTSAASPTPAPTAIQAIADTPSPQPTPPPAPTRLATTRPPATPTLSPAPDTAYPSAVVLETANLRAGPGLEYPVIGQVNEGQEVQVRARTQYGSWMQLEMEGEGQVWVADFLLDLPAGIDFPISEDFAAPPPPPTPGDAVHLGQTTVSISTYPWRQFTSPAYDPVYDWEYLQFDRAAYEAANPQPSPQTYALQTLDNRWLHLSLMPELGGRLFQMVFKATGNNELYQNPVIKPSPWGPGANGNGWLAAGGIEWGLPVSEHGYTWNETWGYITTPGDQEASITVFDQGQDRLHLSVDAGMQPDSAAFTLDYRLENRGVRPVDANFWSNAMLAPGPANRVGSELRFLYPSSQMRVHSTGDGDLPGPGGPFAWPMNNGRDISRLGTWQRWLGFFAASQGQSAWAAVYDEAADEGVVRIFSPVKTPGLKGFGLGWSDPIPANQYTDGDSSYVEMQGGISPDFDTARTMAPDELLSWREIWYPVAGIGGISNADANGAVHVTSTDGGWRLRIFPTRSMRGELVVLSGGSEIHRQEIDTDPGRPLDVILSGPDQPTGFRITLADGGEWAMNSLSRP
ncbi:MAG: DUF5107 domain-containing protein [Caldilineales bacterium]|nr:DUF5107 domain-containing protein [Caldilineales bacterium]